MLIWGRQFFSLFGEFVDMGHGVLAKEDVTKVSGERYAISDISCILDKWLMLFVILFLKVDLREKGGYREP